MAPRPLDEGRAGLGRPAAVTSDGSGEYHCPYDLRRCVYSSPGGCMSSGLSSMFVWLVVATMVLWFIVLLPRILRRFSFTPEFIIGAMVSLAGIDLWTPGLSSSPTGHRTFTTSTVTNGSATLSVGLFKDANHLVSVLFLLTLVLGLVYFFLHRDHEPKHRWVVFGGFAITAGTFSLRYL